MARGHFRQDLYYRLKVFPISVPALRHRREDIPLLVSHFIHKQAELSGKSIQGVQHRAMRLLMDYDWPGNGRELENAVQHAFVLCNQDLISAEDLPREIREGRKQHPAYDPEPSEAKGYGTERGNKPSKQQLWHLLRECGWNKAETARRLGISRTAVWKYMKKWAIPLRDPDRIPG